MFRCQSDKKLTSYVIQTKHLRASAPGVYRWCLDFPVPGSAVSLSQLDAGILFQGWLLQDTAQPAQVYVRQGGQVSYVDLAIRRADVVEKVLKQTADAHPQLCCGFSCQFTLHSDHVVLGFVIAGQHYDFVDIRIESSMKVLPGTFPWLFLDNDTNQSVAQFTGELSLNRQTLEAWQHYLQALSSLPPDSDKWVVLLAPTKEMVYPQYYPHSQAGHTPVQQLMAHVANDPLILYPAAQLASAAERSFRYTDTHWTHHAAMRVSVLLAQRLGLAAQDVEAVFAADQYTERNVCGDLGNKLFPPREAKEQLLSSFSYKQYLRYENGLPNFGRVMLFENPSALSSQHCLIFGASSSYSMLNYLVRLYAAVTIVHTAGNVDPAVVAAIMPDCVICQTNERFIVRAPVVHYSLADIMQDKLAEMTPQQSSAVLQLSADSAGARYHSYFHSLLSKR